MTARLGIRSTALAGVLLLTLAAPWAFGARERYYALTLGLALLPAVLLVGASGLRARAAALGSGYSCWLLLGAVLPGLWLLPLGETTTLACSGAWSELTARLPELASYAHTLSLVPETTWWAWLLAAGTFGAGWVVFEAGRHSPRARGFVAAALLALATALALFGLVQRVVDYSPERIYWTFELYEVGTPFGPYVNRNHFAGLMVLLGGVAAGELLRYRKRDAAVGALLSGAVLMLVATALLATTSRGGLLGGVTATAVVLLWTGAWRRRLLWVGLALAAGALVVATMALDTFGELSDRLFTMSGRWRNRFRVQANALELFSLSPWVGIGPGTFAEGFHAFQTIDDGRYFSDAHSDWVQLLAELGVFAILMVVSGVAVVWRLLRRSFGQLGDERGRVIGIVSGLVGLSVHGFFETNLRVPANALTAVVALSLACSAAAARTAREATPTVAD